MTTTMLHELPGTKIKALPWGEVNFIDDLAYFEGPKISHYVTESGQNLVYIWVDCSDDLDRWLAIRANARQPVLLRKKRLTTRQLVEDAFKDQLAFFLDIERHSGNVVAFSAVTRAEMPEDYLPYPHVYIDASAPTKRQATEEFVLPIAGDWTMDLLAEFPRVFRQVYAFIQYVSTENPKAGRAPPFPHREGFSAMHYFNFVIRQTINTAVKLTKVRYASPGEIVLSGDENAANSVLNAVERMLISPKQIRGAARALETYISARGLNKDTAELPSEEENSKMAELADELLKQIGGITWKQLMNRSSSAFQAAKVALGYYSRLRTMADYEREGLTEMTSTRFDNDE